MTPANDNRPTTQRPAGFDAALQAYMPKLRKYADYLARSTGEGEELLQESVLKMLRCAGNCRMETFKTWAQWKMKNTASAMRIASRRQMRSATTVSFDTDEMGSTAHVGSAGGQQLAAELAEACRSLDVIKDGDLLLRRAMGDTLKEIGDELGVTREAIRQREERARTKLRAA